MFQERKGRTDSPVEKDVTERTEVPVITEESRVTVRERVLSQLKRFVGLDRHPDDPFNQVMDTLDAIEKKDQREMEDELKRAYQVWSEQYELLKQEFLGVTKLFLEIEERVEGWYYVSPNLGQWGPVGLDAGGYTFAAGVMKNHSRGAPLADKSLTVTFGMDLYKNGMGDERMLGRTSEMDDQLVGIERCTGKTILEQYEASKQLLKILRSCRLHFRLNHKEIGQKVAEMQTDMLEKYSLREICEGLYTGLNQDVLLDIGQDQLPGMDAPLLLEAE